MSASATSGDSAAVKTNNPSNQDTFQGVYVTYLIVGACILGLLITFNFCILYFRSKNEAYLRKKTAATGGGSSNRTNSSGFTRPIGFGAKGYDLEKMNSVDPDATQAVLPHAAPAMLERANIPNPLVIVKQKSADNDELFEVVTVEHPNPSSSKVEKAQEARKTSVLPESTSMIGTKSPGSLGQVNIISRSDSKKGSREALNMISLDSKKGSREAINMSPLKKTPSKLNLEG